MNPPQFQNDQDIVIYLGDPTPVEQEQEGAGRWFQVLKRPLTIQLRSRAWVDLSDRDSNFLLQTTNHLTFEDTVVNALSEFYPTDSNGNLTTVEALHFSPSSKPMKPNKTQIDWYQSLMVFELVYQSNITQSS
jgi:hypothetical protein